MGHRRPGALPYDNVVVLPGRARHHRRVRLHRPGVVQQRQTVAGGDRTLRLRERQQAAGRQQVRPADEEGGRHHHGYGIREPARHPVPGDVREERHQRGAGIHDDGGGDQEPRRAPFERGGSAERRQDRQEPQRRGQGRLLLNCCRFPATTTTMATTATTLVVAEEDEEGEEEEEAAADKLFSGLLIYYIDYDFLCLVHFPLEIKMKQARASFAAAARIKINNLMIKEEKKRNTRGLQLLPL